MLLKKAAKLSGAQDFFRSVMKTVLELIAAAQP